MASCFEYALKYIHLYPKTEQELRTKLHTKQYTQDEIDRTIEVFQQKGYIDDVQFTKLYIESELVKKGKTEGGVINKLLHKGVARSIINEQISIAKDGIQTGIMQRIQKEIEKYKKRGLDGYEIIVKIAQRGYAIHDIKKAIKQSQ